MRDRDATDALAFHACPGLPAQLRCAWRTHAGGLPAEDQARAWLGGLLGCSPDAVPLHRDARGRPRLVGDAAGCDASWSHSGDRLLLAFGRALQLGVDLERERPRPRALALARRFFARAEADWLATLHGPARESAFVRLWCAKEAVLKAHGRGLAFGLQRLRFAERGNMLFLADCDAALGAPGDWSLREWSPQPGYRAALAWRSLQEGLQARPGPQSLRQPAGAA
jgi:4'-phosphopantetheinyl transferase